jgi:hypothetical protein
MVVREELAVDLGRIDVARIGDQLEGYEIKSDVDKLCRLDGQVQAFNGVFDKLTLVVGHVHWNSGSRRIPPWWGVILAECSERGHGVVLRHIRKPQQNPEQRASRLARLLWRGELDRVFSEVTGKRAPKRSSRADVAERFDDEAHLDPVRQFVTSRLRDAHRWESLKAELLEQEQKKRPVSSDRERCLVSVECL